MSSEYNKLHTLRLTSTGKYGFNLVKDKQHGADA